MKFKKVKLPRNDFIYCAIRIPHIYHNNKSIYHLAEHLFYRGLCVPQLKITQGFRTANFIYSATAFTNKVSINICFICSANSINKVQSLFEIIKNRDFKINSSVFDKEKMRVCEEIRNRKYNSFLNWRDIILHTALEDSEFSFDEVGNINEINNLSLSDIMNYIMNPDLFFDFYFSNDKNEFTNISSMPKDFLIDEKPQRFLINSLKQQKISVVSIIPITSKNTYIYALLYIDYIFNVNNSILEKRIADIFSLNDEELDIELVNNYVVSHFTLKYNSSISVKNLITEIRYVLSEKTIITNKEIVQKLNSLRVRNKFSLKNIFYSQLRLFRLTYSKYNLSDKDFFNIDTDKAKQQINKYICELNRLIELYL